VSRRLLTSPPGARGHATCAAAHVPLHATCACSANSQLRTVPILFFANKMDLPQAVGPVQCVQNLELDKIGDKPWHIAASNGLTGDGIDEGITWLGAQMSRMTRK